VNLHTPVNSIAISFLILFVSANSTVIADDDFSWIRGANYTASYAKHDIEMWMDWNVEVIDRELQLAGKLKLNCIRVFLPSAVYEHDPKAFVKKFEALLALCEKHNLQMQPTLFGTYHGHLPDLKNYRLYEDWYESPGYTQVGKENWPRFEKYVKDIVGSHLHDKRIVMWDIMNEPMNLRAVRTKEIENNIWLFVRHFCDYTRSLKPRQPITVGLMREDKDLKHVIDNVDVITFHCYSGSAKYLTDTFRRIKATGEKHGKPMCITEIGHRGSGGVQHFQNWVPLLREEKVGWFFWELMLGKTKFSRGENPIQGVITTDGQSYHPDEIAAILDTAPQEAAKLFPKRGLPSAKDIEDGAATYKGRWTRWTGIGPRGGRLFYANGAGSEATLTFTGTQVVLIHKVGPDCGIAEVVSGEKVIKEIDTYAPTVEWNKTTMLASELTGKDERTITIKVTGRKNPASRDSHIQIVGFDIK